MVHAAAPGSEPSKASTTTTVLEPAAEQPVNTTQEVVAGDRADRTGSASTSTSTSSAPPAELEERRKRLWKAAIKIPMYSVGYIPVLVGGAKGVQTRRAACMHGLLLATGACPSLHPVCICSWPASHLTSLMPPRHRSLVGLEQVGGAAVFAELGTAPWLRVLGFAASAICVIAWLNLRCVPKATVCQLLWGRSSCAC